MEKIIFLFVLNLIGFIRVNAQAESGGDPCGSGPTFWCANAPNARECNETEFCRKVCWKPELDWNMIKLYRRKMNQYPAKQFIQLCFQNKKSHALATFPPAANMLLCDECKLVIGKLDQVLKDKSVIESVIVAIRFFCNLLPAYSTQCRNMVNDLYELIDKLEPYLRDPEKFCAELHVCPSNLYDLNEHTPIFYFLHKYYTTDMNATINDNSLCDDCVEAINNAKAQLEDPAQQKNIMETFHEFCSYFGFLKKECDDYVDNYVPQLLNAMITYLSDAKGVCSRLGFCMTLSNDIDYY